MNGQDSDFEPPTWSQSLACVAGFAFVLAHSVILLLIVLAVALLAAVLYGIFF